MSKIISEEKPPADEQQTPFASPETEYRDRYRRARERVDAIRGFYIHLAVYVLVNLCLFAINMVSDPNSLWFYWPLLGWGVAVAIHALTVFWPVAAPGSDWEQRKIREYMEKDR